MSHRFDAGLQTFHDYAAFKQNQKNLSFCKTVSAEWQQFIRNSSLSRRWGTVGATPPPLPLYFAERKVFNLPYFVCSWFTTIWIKKLSEFQFQAKFSYYIKKCHKKMLEKQQKHNFCCLSFKTLSLFGLFVSLILSWLPSISATKKNLFIPIK